MRAWRWNPPVENLMPPWAWLITAALIIGMVAWLNRHPQRRD